VEEKKPISGKLSQKAVQTLLSSAFQAKERAYAPYSLFRVGSALLDEHGHTHLGCNVENAAYSPSNCAERTAMFRAIADGVRPGGFQALAVVADTAEPVTPCGVCRQVMAELCPPDMIVFMANKAGSYVETTVAELLPGAFGAKILHSHADDVKKGENT